MLEEKLSAANEAAAKRRLVGIGYVVAAVVISVLGFLAIQWLDRTTTETASTSAVSADRALPSGTANVDSDPAARDAFKEGLKRFEDEVAPRLAGPGFAAWDATAASKILEMKNDAINSFGAGAYGQANTKLSNLEEFTESAIADWDSYYSGRMEQASGFHDADDYENALIQINDALRVRPESAEANEIKQKIEHLPEVLTLLKTAEIAQSENQDQKELDALRRVMVLQPDRQGLSGRIETLEKQVLESSFRDQISIGLAAAAKGDHASARAAMLKAEEIYPSREELKALKKAVFDLGQQIEFRNLVQRSQEAIKNDAWEDARRHLEAASKIDPESEAVISALNLSRQVLGTMQNMAHLLERPDRLSSNNIRQSAKLTLERAEPYLGASQALKSRYGELSRLLERYDTPLSVKVVSDNLTFVEVKGVGKVGLVAEKLIKLRPGRYVFRGTREGFKVKTVEVEISPGNVPITVEVIPDERI